MGERRAHSGQRGYDAAWRRRRAAHLDANPTCELCGAQANTVDHRRPRRRFLMHQQGSEAEGGSEHSSNLRSLCGSDGRTEGKGGCHNRRKEDKA